MKTQLQSFCGSLGYDTVQPGQNCMHLGVNSRFNSGNTCCHSVQKLLSSQLLTNNYNFAPCFIQMSNFVSHFKGQTQVEGVQEQDAKEEIWA